MSYTVITSFNYAYAVDNNCSINPVHILQIKFSLGCIEDRLDKLENATPVASGVTSLTSSNSAITLSASSGDIVITPQWQLLGNATFGTITILNQNLGTLQDRNFVDGSGLGIGANNVGIGEYLNVNSALIGNTVNSLTFGLKKIGSPTGDANICAFDVTDSTCIYKFGTLSLPTLTTSYAQYTFTNFNSDYIITSDIVLGIKGPSQSLNNLNRGVIAISTTDVYDSTNSVSGSLISTSDVWVTANTIDVGSSTANTAFLVQYITRHVFFDSGFNNIIFIANVETETNTMQLGVRFNSDSSVNYAHRMSLNNGADTTGVSQTACLPLATNNINTADNPMIVGYINNNLASDRKLITGNVVTGADSAITTAPSKIEFVCKWGNTTNEITSIALEHFAGSGGFTTNTRLTVWGYN